MKIVLCEPVENLGERGDVVTVAAGYARNFLLPKRLAQLATPGNLNTLEHRRRTWAIRETRETSEAEAMAARLGAVELTVTRKAGESGALYGSVTSSEIASLLAEQGIEINRRKIRLDGPLKAVGVYEIPIKIHRHIPATIKVEVAAEAGRQLDVAPLENDLEPEFDLDDE